MSPLNTTDLHLIFADLDQNGDGLLSAEEVNCLLDRIQINLSVDDLKSLLGKPSLNFNEFMLFYDSISKTEVVENTRKIEERDLLEAFNAFDSNGDGLISCKELQNVLSRLGALEENGGRDCTSMIRKYDSNLDGMVDFQEFKNMMLHPTT